MRLTEEAAKATQLLLVAAELMGYCVLALDLFFPSLSLSLTSISFPNLRILTMALWKVFGHFLSKSRAAIMAQSLRFPNRDLWYKMAENGFALCILCKGWKWRNLVAMSFKNVFAVAVEKTASCPRWWRWTWGPLSTLVKKQLFVQFL